MKSQTISTGELLLKIRTTKIWDWSNSRKTRTDNVILKLYKSVVLNVCSLEYAHFSNKMIFKACILFLKIHCMMHQWPDFFFWRANFKKMRALTTAKTFLSYVEHKGAGEIRELSNLINPGNIFQEIHEHFLRITRI